MAPKKNQANVASPLNEASANRKSKLHSENTEDGMDVSLDTHRPKKVAKSVHGFPLKKISDTVGEVFVVGSGDCGQLGLGPDVFEKERPARLEYFADKNIIFVVAGGMHNIAISLEGKLYSWGCNDQLALGRSGEETTPAPVEGLDHEVIVQVACGDSISVALTEDGRVYNWGTFRNNTGIFGMKGGVEAQARPTLVPDLKHVVSIAAGSNHCVAVTVEGKIYTWGVGDQGQLGRKIVERHTFDSSLTPRAINFRPYRMNAKFTRAFCGSYHTFLVHESNAVFSFGLNNYGQLGIGNSTEDSSWTPERVLELDENEGISMLSGGEHHSMALTENGKIYSFGRGDTGQLGHPDKENEPVAKLLSGIPETAKSISCGSSFSLAVTSNEEGEGNNLYMWGYGEMGQLANGCMDIDEPEQINLKGREVLSASAGGQHTVFLIKPKNN